MNFSQPERQVSRGKELTRKGLNLQGGGGQVEGCGEKRAHILGAGGPTEGIRVDTKDRDTCKRKGQTAS